VISRPIVLKGINNAQVGVVRGSRKMYNPRRKAISRSHAMERDIGFFGEYSFIYRGRSRYCLKLRILHYIIGLRYASCMWGPSPNMSELYYYRRTEIRNSSWLKLLKVNNDIETSRHLVLTPCRRACRFIARLYSISSLCALVLGMTLNFILSFIVTGSSLY